MARSRKTSARVAKLASRQLRSAATGKATKTVAASALSQRAPRRSAPPIPARPQLSWCGVSTPRRGQLTGRWH